MKRNYVWAAALLMLAACSNEEVLTTTDNPDRGNGGQRVTVTATLPGNDSRVNMQEATENGKSIIKVDWAESDEAFTVLTTDEQQVTDEANDGGVLFTQTEGDQFTGTLPEEVTGEPYYAFYPALDLYYDNGEGDEGYYYWDESGGKIKSFSASKVPYHLGWQTGTLDDISMPLMYATSTDGEQFDFHHLTAIVKFTLEGLPTPEAAEEPIYIDVEWEGGCGLYGTLDLTQSTVSAMYPTTTDGGNYLWLGTTIQPDGTATVYTYLPPIAQGKTLDFSFVVIGKDNVYKCTAQVELAKAIEAGMYYRATREVTKTTISRKMTAGTVQELREWLDNCQEYNVGFNLTLTADIDLTNADLDGDPDNDSNWPSRLQLQNVTIDGGGHTLTGLKMNVTGDSEAAAMFHSIDETSVVKNLHLRDVQLSSGGYFAAGVVAENWGTVSGCSVSGTITSTAEGYNSGGVVGLNRGTVTACYNNAAVSATGTDGYAGGVVGDNQSTVTACCSTGTVSATGTDGYAGGVVGDNQSTVTACYSTGTVSATGTGGYAGGVVGGSSSDATVTACYWSGTGATSGIGFYYEPPAASDEGTTQVTGDSWATTVLSAMNAALPTDFGWEYQANTDEETKGVFPLVLQKTSGQ